MTKSTKFFNSCEKNIKRSTKFGLQNSEFCILKNVRFFISKFTSNVCSLFFDFSKFYANLDFFANMLDLQTIILVYLVACTRLYKPLCWSVRWLVGPSVAVCSEYATYGDWPCFYKHAIWMKFHAWKVCADKICKKLISNFKERP